MKKNLIFLGILSLLLTFTYFFQEKRDRDFYQSRENLANTLQEGLEFEKLKIIQLKKTKIEKRDEIYFLPKYNYPASKDRIDDLLRRLGDMKVKRVLEESEVKKLKKEDFLRKDDPFISFTFEKNKNITFTIGKKLEFNDSFYVKLQRDNKESVVIAAIEEAKESFIGNEDEYQRYQYDELISLIRKKESFYLRHEVLLPSVEISMISSIQIEGNHNRPFKVDFKENQTTPRPYGGGAYEKEAFTSFLKELGNFSANELIFKAKHKDLKHLVSKVLLTLSNGNEITLKIFSQYQDQKGYFLSISDRDNLIFKLNQMAAKIFFTHVQDFWSKSVLSEKSLFDQGDVTFKMEFSGNKIFEIKIPYEKEFKVEIVSAPDQEIIYQPNVNAFKSLFLILMGTYREKARHISPLSETDKKKHLIKDYIKLHIPSYNLLIAKVGDEFIIDQNDKGFKIHYLFNEVIPFDLDIDSFFYPQDLRAKGE